MASGNGAAAASLAWAAPAVGPKTTGGTVAPTGEAGVWAQMGCKGWAVGCTTCPGVLGGVVQLATPPPSMALGGAAAWDWGVVTGAAGRKRPLKLALSSPTPVWAGILALFLFLKLSFNYRRY